MSLVKINWDPNRKELGDFGKIAVAALAIVSLLLYIIKGIAVKWALIIFAAGAAIFIISLISPKVTRLIYLGMTLAAAPIGYAVSFIVLALFYFLLITPIALAFRLAGRDPLNRRFEQDTDTYWIKRHPPDRLDRYFRQF